MIKIAPSILSADFANLGQDVKAIASADYIHFDVMDGAFVPNISFGIPVLKSVRAVTDMFLDVHLMIEKPARYIDAFAKAGADLLSVHLESDGPTGIADALRAMEANRVKKAVALRPITSAKAIMPYLEQLDLVLVMSVEPGFGGQKFMPSALDKLRWLKAEREARGAHYLLEVDGGVDNATAPQCVEAGADILVAGSAVFGAADPAAAVQHLASL